MPCRCCDQGCFATPLPSRLSNSDAGRPLSPLRGTSPGGGSKGAGDGVRRHTAALLNPCDAVQILCSPKLRFSRALTCLVFPKPGVAFAVLYQADAFRSFAMPTPDDSMPLLLYAFPWPSFAKPFPCCSEPCLCGRGERAAQRALLKSAALCRCFATPRLANALHNRCVGFPCPCAALTGSAVPEHHNADAICCFSYAVYFQAFAMPRQSHARPMRRCAKPLRRLGLQIRSLSMPDHCAAPLRFALPLRYKAGAGGKNDTSSVKRLA